MVELAVRYGGPEARAFLEELRHHEIAPRAALEGLIRLESLGEPDRAFELASGAEGQLGEPAMLALRAAGPAAELASLVRVASAVEDNLRRLSVELLAARGPEGGQALRDLLTDPVDSIALAAFAALLELPEPGIDPAEVAATLGERKGLGIDSELGRLRAHGRDADELREQLNWVELKTAGTYRALAEEHFADFGEELRRDLGDGFAQFAASSRELFLARFPKNLQAALRPENPELPEDAKANASLDELRAHIVGGELNERRFTPAALAGITAHGEPADAPLARSRLDSGSAEVRSAAALALERVGGAEDVDRLIQLAYGRRDGALFARVALALAPDPGPVALALLDTVRTETALVGARRLVAGAADLSEEMLDQLLGHPDVGVRRIGVAAALERAGGEDAPLAALLDRLLGQETYYYNVICLLDTLLYAPPALRLRTRSELEAFAAEQRPVPLPALSERADNLAAALARRHLG